MNIGRRKFLYSLIVSTVSFLTSPLWAFGSKRIRKRRLNTSKASFYEIAIDENLTTNLLLCLDAGAIDSYSGGTSQTWSNLVPAVGTSFYRGAGSTSTSTDPTFNGTAGNMTELEYFQLDGGDYFTEVTAGWGDDTFINNNQSFTVVHILYPTSASLTSLLDNMTSGTWRGIYLQMLSSRALSVGFDNGSGTNLLFSSTNLFTLNNWNFSAVALNEATGSGTFRINSLSESFNSTRSGSPSSGAGPARIGLRNRTTTYAPNGTRIAGVMIWNRELSDSELATLFSAIKLRRFPSLA